MIKFFFLLIFFFMSAHSLQAAASGDEQELMSELDNVKNPFEDGLPVPPKPVVVDQPISADDQPKTEVLPAVESMPVAPPEIVLPDLKLQGVIVGEDIHQAIIDDQAVPLHGIIKGARLISVTKQGVEMSFQGKKFFLKVD